MIIQKIFNEIKIYLSNAIDNIIIDGRIYCNDKGLIIMSFLIFILFIYLSYFIYNKYIKSSIYVKHALNREFVNKENDFNDINITIVLFKTEWCPYCISIKSEWEDFQNYIYNINKTNKQQVNLVTVDCDENKTLADKYNIDSYPTIKMFNKGEIYNYDAKINKDHLIKFLKSSVDFE